MEGWGHLYLYLWLKYESGLSIELFSKYKKSLVQMQAFW